MADGTGTLALEGLSVLVLEDEFFIALAMEDFLREAGAALVTTATTVARARELAAISYDAAILDVRLPDGTSYPLAQELLEQQIGVTFHSGHTEAEDMRSFPNAVFCAKPSTPQDVIGAVLASITLVSSEKSARS